MTVPSHPWASVIVPIKDERDNLVPLTEQLLKALESRDESRSAPFEILFVDDGSTDGSSDLLDRLAADYPRVRVLHFDRNYGQSSAFDAGFKYSTGDLVITIDGDLQNDPADIGTLLPHVKTFDLVCGWRTNRHDNLVRTVSSRIANAVRGAVTGDRVHDTGCSLKIFRRAVVDKLQLMLDAKGEGDVVFSECGTGFGNRIYFVLLFRAALLVGLQTGRQRRRVSGDVAGLFNDCLLVLGANSVV